MTAVAADVSPRQNNSGKDFQIGEFAPTDVGGYGNEVAVDVNSRRFSEVCTMPIAGLRTVSAD